MRFSIMRYRAWQFMRSPKHTEFTLWQLRRALECPDRTIRTYVELLLAGGYLEIAKDLRGNGKGEYSYRLVRDTGLAVPCDRGDKTIYDPNLAGRVESGQQRMWNALRGAHAALSKEELSIRAEVSASYSSNYLQELERYGYLRAECRPKLYFLIRDTGPIHPAWQHSKLFDQNLGEYQEVLPE